MEHIIVLFILALCFFSFFYFLYHVLVKLQNKKTTHKKDNSFFIKYIFINKVALKKFYSFFIIAGNSLFIF